MIIDHIEAATLIGGSTNDADPRFRSVVFAANKEIEDECRRQFTNALRTEYPRSFAWRDVWLKETPVRSITEIRYDISGAFGDGTIVDPASYSYDANSGLLRFVFPIAEGSRLLKVTYQGGYDPRDVTKPPTELEIPEDLRQLVVRRIARQWNHGPGEKMQSESIGSYSYTRQSGIDPDDARAIRKYRR